MRVPDWVLERYAAGELSESYTAEYIAADGTAPERLAALRRSNEEILAAHPPADVAREVERRAHLARVHGRFAGERRSGSWLRGGLAVAAVAAVVAVVVPRLVADEVRHDEGRDEVRYKGDPRLLVYRQTANTEPERLSSGARVRVGDLLQLRILAAGARYAAVVSIDGAGSVTLHAPRREEDQAMAVHTGETETLPESYALDAAGRFERFVLVTSDRQFSAAEVLAAAREVGAEPTAPLALPDSLRQSSFVVRKDAP